jgi:serine/threonine-protein kinase HipA
MTEAQLGVWWGDGTSVATIDGDGPTVRLTYTPDALDAWPANTPLLSCCLPVRPGSMDASPFMRGLLPEGQHLAGVAAAARLAVTDTTGLLARYGRDVAGALVIAQEFPGPRPGRLVGYTAETLAQEVTGMTDTPLGVHDDSELSIAGLQDKLLLVRTDDGWSRPANGAPSTHILKLDDRRHPGLVAAGAACLRIAKALDLTDIDVEETTIGEIECLIVSRFDRHRSADGTIERIHQEDLSQATGREPTMKYERSGGPTLRDAAELLDAYSAEPAEALDRLVALVTFTVLIGNADAHGKNLAFLHVGDKVEAAPLYDQVPTVLWPNLRREPALSIGPRVTSIHQVTSDDIVAEAKLWSHSVARARSVVLSTAERAREGTRGIEHDDVAQLVRRNADRLLKSTT